MSVGISLRIAPRRLASVPAFPLPHEIHSYDADDIEYPFAVIAPISTPSGWQPPRWATPAARFPSASCRRSRTRKPPGPLRDRSATLHEVARVKGITFADAREFVVSRGGIEAWQRLRAGMSTADQALLDEVIALGWYDLAAHARMLDAMPKALGLDAQTAMHEYARFSAQNHVSKVHRVLLRLANPAFILEKTGEYWSRFYDSGEWRITREGPRRARGDLQGFALPAAIVCTFLTSYIEFLFARVGAKDVKTSHPRCRVRGDAVCTFVVEWK
jgi:hypothetical protein